jgi:CRISPR-associated endonuclease/helicase Cas3
MMPLSPDDFAAWFEETYGYEPFPWQDRLARLACNGNWPTCIALPTASGKTACIDIAIFALACQADLAEQRTAARRIFFVVDRRVIVDEAFQRAEELAGKLRTAKSGLTREVADRLRKLAGDNGSDPLFCRELRGGVYRDNNCFRSPLQPMVVCSTVDQVGSRLLYRGYGISTHLAPVHAAMVSNDSLIILDEAHCSNPLRQTVEAVKRYRTWGTNPVRSPFNLVVMSATPSHDVPSGSVFRDEQADRDHPIMGKRLHARKPTRLAVAAKARGSDALGKLAMFIAEQARGLIHDHDDVKAVGIIVNRVATAEMIYSELKKNNAEWDAVLLTGRMRPYDKDKVIAKWQDRIAAKPGRLPLDRPVFIVSTQCLEVGANLDFDAMISECASLDALRQRFGRLNRLGLRSQSPGIIVIQQAQSEDDPIYGPSLNATWQWLQQHAVDATIDLGIASMNELLAENQANLTALSVKQPDAPVMLPAHVDCWVQTAPVPCPDPDVSLFLHGPDNSAPEVQVVWRADLDAGKASDWQETISRCPPTVQECLPVQLHVVRRWWNGMNAPTRDATDLESGRATPDDDATDNPKAIRQGLIWRGLEDSRVIDNPTELLPGDTLVLPVSAGGWDVLGHLPETGQDGDLVDIADLVERPITLLRVHPALKPRWSHLPAYQRLLEIAADPESRDDTVALREALREFADDPTCPVGLKAVCQGRLSLAPYPADTASDVWRAMVISSSKTRSKRSAAVAYEDDTSSTGLPITLAKHNQDVASLAERFARLCGLPDMTVEDLGQAGGLHDVGKADMRLQAWLHGGNRREAEAYGQILAKSLELPSSSEEFRISREKSGYPRGGRHELLSVRLAESQSSLFQSADRRGMILHLIASHHGRCRPFAPVVEDRTPEDVLFMHDGQMLRASSATTLERLDSGVAERFWLCVRRYGWWGVAYLEAILRLADWTVSEMATSKEELP